MSVTSSYHLTYAIQKLWAHMDNCAEWEIYMNEFRKAVDEQISTSITKSYQGDLLCGNLGCLPLELISHILLMTIDTTNRVESYLACTLVCRLFATVAFSSWQRTQVEERKRNIFRRSCAVANYTEIEHVAMEGIGRPHGIVGEERLSQHFTIRDVFHGFPLGWSLVQQDWHGDFCLTFQHPALNFLTLGAECVAVFSRGPTANGYSLHWLHNPNFAIELRHTGEVLDLFSTMESLITDGAHDHECSNYKVPHDICDEYHEVPGPTFKPGSFTPEFIRIDVVTQDRTGPITSASRILTRGILIAICHCYRAAERLAGEQSRRDGHLSRAPTIVRLPLWSHGIRRYMFASLNGAPLPPSWERSPDSRAAIREVAARAGKADGEKWAHIIQQPIGGHECSI